MTRGSAFAWLAVVAAGGPAFSQEAAQTADTGARVSVVSLRSPAPPMVRIPAGYFVRGSTLDEMMAAMASCMREPLAHRCEDHAGFADELGKTTLWLPAFYIDRTEVTVEAYARCVAVGRCEPPGYEKGATRFAQPSYPVTFVNFDDALSYCEFRGARLPSEAEFERAARGKNGRRFPWGQLYNAHAANHGRFALIPNDESDGYAELAPVGAFPAGKTPEGVLDLAGNVAEWVADPYLERYTDQHAKHGGQLRVVRGGSFESAEAFLRGAARRGIDKDWVSPSIGFRCARRAPGPSSPQKQPEPAGAAQ